MNVNDTTAIRACTSCQMCGAVCPKDAISIHLNDDGFYRPLVYADKCVDCGLCTKVCYRFDSDIKETDDTQLSLTKLYAASANDDKIVKGTTSGGIGDLLAKELIREGYKVVGVVYDSEKDCAIHKIANTESDTDAFRGSKYIQSYSLDALKEVVAHAKTERYAFFGLPCQIYAVTRYLERLKIRENHLLIDLYCHGCPTIFAWTKVSQHIKSKCGTVKFSNVVWRSKLRGWGTFVLEAQSEGKRIYNTTPMHNEFFNFFFCNQVLNESCTDCKLRGTLAYTDIRMGDYWGKLYDKTTRGMSGISICSEKAQQVFNKIKPHITSEEKAYNTFLPYQSWSHVYNVNPNLRNRLMDALRNPTISMCQAGDILRVRQNLLAKLKIFVKQIIFYMPLSVARQFRKIIK